MDEQERERIKERIIADFLRYPILAHRTLFAHRHPNESPAFLTTWIEDLHSDHSRVLGMMFRGAAKSTTAEEAITIKALTRRHRNMIIIGENEDRAKERLRSIRHEFEMNQFILEIFGNMQGPTWGETKIELSTGIMIQAYGRGQSLRGAKYLDLRPDFVFCDDLEDQDSVLTKESRRKVKDWFWQVLIPGMDNPTKTPLRIAATPLHEEALAVKLSKLDEFKVLTVPVEYVDAETGERRASWPSRFPLEEIDVLKQNFYKSGNSDLFQQEYMCETSDPKQKVFTSEMFVYDEAIEHTYQACFAIYDPARTVKATSARTGKVVASWMGSRLIVWEAGAY